MEVLRNLAERMEKQENPIPEVGEWIKFSGENKRKPGQWFWGKVVRTDLMSIGYRFTVDTGSGGLEYFYLKDIAKLNKIGSADSVHRQ